MPGQTFQIKAFDATVEDTETQQHDLESTFDTPNNLPTRSLLIPFLHISLLRNYLRILVL